MPDTVVPPATTSPTPSTFTQILYQSAGAEVPPDAKYIFGTATVELPDFKDRQFVGCIMSSQLAAECAALRNDPRVNRIPALRALLGHMYRASRPTTTPLAS